MCVKFKCVKHWNVFEHLICEVIECVRSLNVCAHVVAEDLKENRMPREQNEF